MKIADITVITASYNSQQFLEAAIHSVATQTQGPKKQFIIDDYSTDDRSYRLAKGLAAKHPYIEVVRHDKNKGYSAALNTGIARSQTEYIAILDSDDIAYENWIELTTRFLDAHPEYGLVGGGGNIMTEHGIVTHYSKYCEHQGDVTSLIKTGVYPLFHGGAVFRRSLLMEMGGYREDLKSSEDNNLFINFSHLSKLYNLGQPLIYYRRLRASESRVSKRYRDLMDQYIETKLNLLQNGLSISDANVSLSPIVDNMQLAKLKKGHYQHDMGAAFFLGKQYYRALLYLLAAFVVGNGFKNLKWAASIIKNKLMMRY